MFSGFYMAQSVTPETDKKISLSHLQDRFSKLQKVVDKLIDLENQYNKKFEVFDLADKKVVSKFKLFPDSGEPLLPDLGLKKEIKEAEKELKKLHQEFVELQQAEKYHLKGDPKYKQILDKYYAIAYHFHEESDDVHVVVLGK